MREEASHKEKRQMITQEKAKKEEHNPKENLEVKCINHFINSGGYEGNGVPGYGDCSKCQPDSVNNFRCKGYDPVKIRIVRYKIE